MVKNGGGFFPLFSCALTLMVALAILLVALTGMAAASKINLVPGDGNVNPGNTTTYQIVMDSAPDGLAGYDMSISLDSPGVAEYDMSMSLDSPGVAEIESVSYPSWVALNQTGSLPADNVRINAVDLNSQVQSGSTKTPLANITIKGKNPGTTRINLNIQELDADGGNPINAETNNGQLTVEGSGGLGGLDNISAGNISTTYIIAALGVALLVIGAFYLLIFRRH